MSAAEHEPVPVLDEADRNAELRGPAGLACGDPPSVILVRDRRLQLIGHLLARRLRRQQNRMPRTPKPGNFHLALTLRDAADLERLERCRNQGIFISQNSCEFLSCPIQFQDETTYMAIKSS